MTERVGYSQYWTPPTASASTWRGLSLNGGGLLGPLSAGNAIPWDVLLAETDGIRSTGTHTFGAITVPTGAAGVVPSGMAGLWRLVSQCEVNVTSDNGQWEYDIVINNFAFFVGDSRLYGTSPDRFTGIVSPFVFGLDEGDVVWCNFSPFGGDADIGGSNSTFLMEFVSPA